MKPSIGRIVTYYQGDFELCRVNPDVEWMDDDERNKYLFEVGPTLLGWNGTRFHPAIITQVHTDTCVNLCVFYADGTIQPKFSMSLQNSELPEGMRYSNSGWRWPERVS